MRKTIFSALICSTLLLGASLTQAETVNVAVAANFTAPMKELAPIFEKATGDKLAISYGSTGAFYTQIKNGATFDILLAADDTTPQRLVKESLASASSRFTYAIGKLVLWSSDRQLVKNNADVLTQPAVKYIAIADAKLAPYGLAAVEFLNQQGLYNKVKNKFVIGDNIGKTFQFVKTGNAQVGFIALSQCYKNGKFTSGSGWIIPQKYYTPIKQDAVLLQHGQSNAGAERFLKFLKTSPEVAQIRQAYGYDSAP